MEKEVDAIVWRGFSPAFIHPDDAARYVHELIDKKREREYGGFILRREGNKFVATLPVAGKANNFDGSAVFAESDKLPVGLQSYAVYHSHPSAQTIDHLVGTELPWEQEQWKVYLNSLSGPDIYSAIYSSKLWPALYLSAPDGTLLKYMASGSEAEKSLEKRLEPISEDTVRGPESEISRAINAQAMTHLDFIRLTAQAGRLSVVVGSPLWGEPKVITADWTPFQKGQISDIAERPTLSPLFSQADDAARYFQKRVRDLDTSGAYAGFLLYNESDQTYLSTLPVTCPRKVAEAMATPFFAKALFKLPDDFALAGLCLSMPKALVGENTAQRGQQHFYSAEDISGFINLARHNAEMCHFYLAIEDGALLKFTVDRIKLAQGLYSKADFEGRQEQRVTKLAELGLLDVLTMGPSWGNKGVVTSDWTPLSDAVGYKQHAKTPIIFSPLFKDANDAARYAHEAIKRSPRVGILGFILKHPVRGTFIAAQPMQGSNAADIINAEETVFRSAEREALTGNFRPLPDLPRGIYSIACISLRFIRINPTPGMNHSCDCSRTSLILGISASPGSESHGSFCPLQGARCSVIASVPVVRPRLNCARGVEGLNGGICAAMWRS